MYSILIVEDEYACMLGLQAIIKNSEFQSNSIFAASNGEEALEIIACHSIDLVITDICMPKMDGLQLCAEIYQKWPNITIIIVSGYDDFKYAQQAIKYNVKDFILKPIKADNLIHSISESLEKMEKEKIQPFSLKKVNSVINKLDSELWSEEPFNAHATCADLFVALQPLFLKEQINFLKDILDNLLQRSKQHLGVALLPELFEIPEETIDPNASFINALTNLHIEILNMKICLNNSFIKEVKTYINENYNSDISLSALSKRFNLNPCYCSQLFKKKVGMTIVQYKTEIRMKKAVEFLQSTNYAITEITFLIGYTDISHFIKTFKKYYGQSPSSYRTGKV